MAGLRSPLLLLLLVLLLTPLPHPFSSSFPASSWLPVAHAKHHHRSLIVNNAKPASESVQRRELVSDHLHYRALLTEHSRHWENTAHRHFDGTVLAYVTPWNAKGYEVAVKFRSKFTHISPVWYQLNWENSKAVLRGKENVNATWISQLRKGQWHSPKIVPRVVLEGGGSLKRMLEENDHAGLEAIADVIVAECRARKFDGVVLEAWSSWVQAGALDAEATRDVALDFVRVLARRLRGDGVSSNSSTPSSQLDLILVIPPPGKGGSHLHVFSSNDLSSLAPDVAAFSLMTYDFSNAYNPGPNAPLKWIQAVLMYLLPHVRPRHIEAFQDSSHGRELRSLRRGERMSEDELAAKVLLGLNFYGNKFLRPQGGGPIVGHEYLSLVDRHRPQINWDDDSKEHMFMYHSDGGVKNEVYFPSLKSIQVRIDEARAWGCGISIWEIGQGLDYFYDLL